MKIFSMLLVNNNRSKAYLQNLLKNDFIPEKIIVLDDSNAVLPEHTDNDKVISQDTQQVFYRESKDLDIGFDEKEHILTTIKKHGLECVVLKTLDINTEMVIEEVKNLKSEFVVYSGPGGTILRKEILGQGKKFLHAHPGWLPEFRGSTTIYYSMLINSEVAASIIIFEEGIDEGPILYRKKSKITESSIDFDYVLDPLIRAATFIEYFKNFNENEAIEQNEEDGSTFYIIHPLIKHFSILKHTKGK